MVAFRQRGGFWVLVQFGLMAGTVMLPVAFPRSEQGAHTVIGIVFGVMGVVLFTVGVVSLGSSLTPMPKPLESATLKTHGVYRFVRHPIYGGIIVGMTGYLLALAALPCLIGAGVLLAFFDLKARREECWLSERYPDYEAYAISTKRFIPWIY